MRITAIAVVLIAVGCGGSVAAGEQRESYSADSFVACLRDDHGLLIPVDDVLELDRPGFAVEGPERDLSLRLDDEEEPKVRGDFTMVRWYGEGEDADGADPELAKVQVYFASSEQDAQVLHDEHFENARKGGASEGELRRDLERRKNVVLTWDRGSTSAMRTQIDRCLN